MKPPRFLLFSALLLACIFGTGCFEIVEDITIHNNGSGEFDYTVNMSQSKTRLDLIMKEDSSEGYRIPSKQEIDADILRAKTTLEKSTGITNVVTTTDWTNYIFTLKFSFNSMNNLNAAVEAISAEFTADHKAIPEASGNFAFAGKIFTRKTNYDAAKEKEKLTESDKNVLRNATYTCIYRFDQAVKSSNSTKSKVSANGKSVMTRFNMLNLATGTESIAHTITLK